MIPLSAFHPDLFMGHPAGCNYHRYHRTIHTSQPHLDTLGRIYSAVTFSVIANNFSV
jgi:hypothetical protein